MRQWFHSNRLDLDCSLFTIILEHMASNLIRWTVATSLIFASTVAADHNVTILATDPGIQYSSNSDLGMYNNNTWAHQENSQCYNQMLTTRLQDSARFSFQGTAVQVRGTIGLKGGILQFNVDGIDYPPFSRSNPVLICDAVIFQSEPLPYGHHVLSAILAREEADLINNQTLVTDSVLSIQHIMYTTRSHQSNLGPILGGAMGGAVFALLIAALLIWWFKGQVHRLQFLRGPSQVSIDNEASPKAIGASDSAGLIVTPFVWLESETQQAGPASRNQNWSSPSSRADPLLPATYSQTRGLTQSASFGDLEREAAGLALGAPRPTSIVTTEPETPASQNGTHERREAHLANQIAHRLADIMHSRVGIMDQIASPPMYDGQASEASAFRSSASRP